MDAGRFAEALNILGPLVSGNVVEANAVFLYGLAAAGAAQHPQVTDENREALLREAIGAFHAMLVEQPGLMGCGLSLRAPSTSWARTKWPGATSSTCSRASRRRRWSPTCAGFLGRLGVIAAMEAEHAHLTTQKTFYVEISRARLHAELVTDDRRALRERLEAATGERIAALEAIAPSPPDGPAKDNIPKDEAARTPMERGGGPASADRRPDPPTQPRRERTYEVELDLDL